MVYAELHRMAASYLRGEDPTTPCSLPRLSMKPTFGLSVAACYAGRTVPTFSVFPRELCAVFWWTMHASIRRTSGAAIRKGSD